MKELLTQNIADRMVPPFRGMTAFYDTDLFRMKVKVAYLSKLSNSEIYEMVSYFMGITEDAEARTFAFTEEKGNELPK